MNEHLPIVTASLAGLALLFILLVFLRQRREAERGAKLDAVAAAQERLERTMREETARGREEAGGQARLDREEAGRRFSEFSESLIRIIAQLKDAQAEQFTGFAQALQESSARNDRHMAAARELIEQRLEALQGEMLGRLDKVREEAGLNAREHREELGKSLKTFDETLGTQFRALKDSNEKKLDLLRETVEGRLRMMQDDNTKKLELMRQTVDEKLQGTLEKRLGESFKLVSERLEQVHKGLGEMQSLASDVGNPQRVLTNVKTRGTWGEVQLAALLGQVLAPDQYEENVATKEPSERVEFAIKLPGRTGDPADVVWLPIDAKFPQEDYLRLVEAQEKADPAAAEAASEQLARSVRQCAKTICAKYINPPKTTDFAILFLPTEGLYAEVVKRTGLSDQIHRDCRVTLAGPSTLWALLNSLQMGFRTLAIEKRSSDVWKILGEVKTEFGKYGAVLEKVQKKLQEASNTIDGAATRTRAIERKLRDVQELPGGELPVLGELEAASFPTVNGAEEEL